MADRYFIGGSGAKNWNDTANWSTSSGGSGGASVPTSSDNVYFDALSLSDTCTLTLDAEANCLDLDMVGLDELLTITSAVYCLNIYGSMTLNSNFTATFTGTAYLYLKATTSVTITSNGTSPKWNSLYLDGVGGEWTNQDDWNIFNTGAYWLYFINGIWNTNGKTINNFSIRDESGAGIREWNLGSSTVYVNSVSLSYFANSTFDAGTSTLYIHGENAYGWRITGAVTYYNVILTGANGGWRIYANYPNAEVTFENLTLAPTGGGTRYNALALLGYPNKLTINDTFTVINSNTQHPIIIYGNTSSSTISAANVSVENCSFRDIIGEGTGDWDFSSYEIGDCGGNSGITFRTGENRYYYEGTGNFHDAKWYSASGGGGVAKGMPLPQDTAIFDANSFSGSATLTIANVRIGSIDMSAVDEAVTLSFSNDIECYGDFILGENISLTHNGKAILCYGRGEWNINTYGCILETLSIRTSKYTLQSDLVCEETTYSALSLYDLGVFDANDYNVTVYADIIINTGTTLYMGNGTWEIISNSSTPFKVGNHTTTSIYGEGSTIKVNPPSATGKIELGDYYFNDFHNIWFTGVNTGYFYLRLYGFDNIKIDAGLELHLAANTYIIGSLTAIGTSGSPITITSETAATHILSKSGEGRVDVEYCDISYSNVDANKFYATNCIDSGNNTNWIFVKVGKIMSKWYSNANKIAGVSRNKIEKIMEVR